MCPPDSKIKYSVFYNICVLMFVYYIMMKQTRINWETKIKHPIKGRLPDEVQPVVKAGVNATKKTETPRT